MNHCKTCHFLVKITGGGLIPGDHVSYIPLTDDDRQETWLRQKDRYSVKCFKEIWTENNLEYISSGSVQERLEAILVENRKESCFYIEYLEGMTPDGATELFLLRNDNRQLKRSYRYTQLGLGIAAIAAVVAGLDNFIEYGRALVNWIASLWTDSTP